MARLPRNHLIEPGFPVHVILRGNNRRKLFSYSTGYLLALHYLREALVRTRCMLNAAAVLSNHLHLVIDPPEPLALSQLIHRFSQRYAVYRNASRGGTGKVFEERFTSVPIRSDRQLAATLAYVELNPVRAGLGREPADYRWTTYRLHTGIRGFRNGEPFDGLWTPSSWYLRLGPTPPDRARAYADFVRERRESTDDLAPSSLDRIAVGIGYDRRPNRARTW